MNKAHFPMNKRRTCMASAVSVVLVAGFLLSRMTGWWSVVGYALLSLLVSAVGARLLLIAYLVEITEKKTRPRKWVMAGVLGIAFIPGYLCFQYLMRVHVIIVYDSPKDLAIVVADGIVVRFEREKGNVQAAGLEPVVRSSIAYSTTLGVVKGSWHSGDDFSIDPIGLGGVRVRAMGNHVVYRKNRSLEINGRTLPLYTGLMERFWGYSRLIALPGG